ncbi:TonB family protein [Andreprevotia chitinilytica]|uniref:TonB family protein n=1 Tax=Andreprevotia chitinilytica TaxID=396808 RepID=UPI0012EBAD25|nr:TonB family protein [Andreprevotia chitinilytica]
MSAPTQSNPFQTRPPFKAMSAALAAEIGLVIIAGLVLTQHLQTTGEKPAQVISLVTAEAPPEPKPEAPAAPKPPAPKVQPPKPAPHPPQAKPRPAAAAAAPTHSEPAPAATDPLENKAATSTPAEPAPPPPPPPSSSSKGPSPSDIFIGKLRAAVQAAVIYPASLRQLGLAGQAEVAFMYQDGAVRDVRISRSSGVGAMDRAAIAAVTAATMPPPPAELQGREHAYVVTVHFRLN